MGGIICLIQNEVNNMPSPSKDKDGNILVNGEVSLKFVTYLLNVVVVDVMSYVQ